MKKKSFIKFMLLAVLLVVGSGMARANVITITGADMTTTDGSQSITKAGVGFDGKMKQYQTTKIWFTSGSGYIYNTTSLGSITKITLSYNAGGSATSVQRFNVGSASMTSYMSSGGTTVSNSTGGTSYDYTGGVGYGYFNISVSSKNLQLVSLVIEYTPAASCTTPTFSFATPTSVSKLTTDAAFTNLLTSDNTSTKVWSSSNEAVATVNSSGLVTIVGAGTTTIGVTQVADGTRCAVSTSYALTVSTPTITLTPTTLTGFTYILGAGPSSQQTFTVSGTNLAGDISIAAPTNYEISKSSGSGYTTPLVYTPAQVSSAQTVYVRLKAGLSVASYNSETITATSTGATDKTVTCSGSVTAPSYTITPSSSNNSHGTVSLSGTVITATPAVGYTYASPAYTVTSGTANVTQNVNEFTVTPTSNCAVRINFEAIPTYTVTFDKGTGNCATASLTESLGGSGVTLPSATPSAACALLNWEFAGWATASQSESTVSPTLYTAGTTYNPVSNTTLYAVYKITEGGGSGTVTINRSSLPTGSGYIESTWTSTASTGETITGKMNPYLNTTANIQLRNTSEPFPYNDVAIPGSITNITMTMPGSGTVRAWTPYMSTNSTLSTSTGGTALATQTFASSSGSLSWDIDPALNYKYFNLSLAGGSTNIASFVISYGSSSTTYNSNPSCSSPSINVSQTTLSGFTYAQGSGPSAAQSFTVSGTNLTNDISIVASTNYEISKSSGSGYTSPLTFTPAEAATPQTVYVRLKAGLTVANYNSEVINITSTGASAKTVTCSGSVTTPEPSNHVTSFTATANSTTSITVTWTDAASVDGYLIKASSTSYGSITAPVDGTTESNGTLVKNVAQGGEIVEFTGLSAGTNYYFKIYPYNGSGLEINYKTDGSVPEATALTSTPLSVPTATAASGVSGNGFTANWNAVSGATSYDVNVYTKAGGGNASDLFISEYIEGASGTNKAIELFNGTGSDVNLSNYSLKKQTNGTGIYKDELVLSGTLANNDVYVIVASASDYAGILANDDLNTNSASIIFNGNDAVGLFKGSTQIDEVGVFNQTSDWGKDVTLIRKSTIFSPNVPYVSNDWSAVSGGTNAETTNLGSHTFDNVASSTPITNSPFTVTGSTNKEVTGLNSGTAYYYTVVAKDAVTTTEASNEITAITAIDETVDVSTLPDCPTCDLVVNDGGVVTLNASKSYNSVSVKPGAKLTLNNGHSFSPGTFTLESDATGTATFVDKRSNANKTNISATIQQHLPAASTRTWWYLASPVDGASYTVFGSNKVGDFSETARSYSNPFSSPTTLVAGKGYVVKMTSTEAANYIFENKTLNTGNISVPLTRTVTQTADNAKRGFNLVGNPYPSYLNWELVYNASTNIRPSIWYRTLDGGSMVFHTYNATLGASVPGSASGYIPPMQAFWVKVDTDPVLPSTVSNATLNMTNDMRSHEGETANPLKAPAVERPLVRLVISNGSASDETVIVAHTAALDGYDSFDSEKMANDNINKPEIYSIAGTQELVISGVSPLSVDKQLSLGVRPGKSGDYSISVGELKGIPADLKVVLKDKHTGAFTELTAGTAYSFNTDGNTVNDRFSLLFRAKDISTDIENGKYLDLQVYGQNGQIVLRSAKLTGAEILVFNALGQPLYAQQSEGTTCTVRGNFTPGVYLVKVNNEVRKVTLK